MTEHPPQPKDLRDVLGSVTPGWLHRHQICPVISTTGQLERVLCTDATDVRDLQELELLCAMPLPTHLVSAEELERAIERTHRHEQDVDAAIAASSDQPDAETRGLASQPPVVRYVNLLVREAVAARASDIHLDATRTGLASRLRVDGVLTSGPDVPTGLHAGVVSRCKLLAGLDIAERRRPQDGRIRIRIDDAELNLRVSTVPTLHGESVVIRILDGGVRPVRLVDLGIPDRILDGLTTELGRSHGMILVTGPTGSGKTTTLYAALAERSRESEKLITVEDPVEYQVAGVTQVPVHQSAGVSFASALRAILRQDPDVLMIGELRDAETAGVAVQAAMTGHLVLATVHTNDALSTFARLGDLDVPDFLLVDTVSAIVAQRLVRRVCARCATRRPVSEAEGQWLASVAPAQAVNEVTTATGCAACRGTGYHGRIGVFEMVRMTPRLREALTSHASQDTLADVARESASYLPLVHDGVRKAMAGLTTLDEVRRVATAS